MLTTLGRICKTFRIISKYSEYSKIIMPTDLIHRISIAAPAEKIYRALTTEEGIQAWWTTDVTLDAHADGQAVFGFFSFSPVFA